MVKASNTRNSPTTWLGNLESRVEPTESRLAILETKLAELETRLGTIQLIVVALTETLEMMQSGTELAGQTMLETATKLKKVMPTRIRDK